MLLHYNPRHCLPSAEDLPDSDDTPVDNELQDLMPHLLQSILALIWSQRQDWYFGVDTGIYYDPYQPAIVPDGFLSVGVHRIIDEDLRLSYVLWEEQKIKELSSSQLDDLALALFDFADLESLNHWLNVK